MLEVECFYADDPIAGFQSLDRGDESESPGNAASGDDAGEYENDKKRVGGAV